MLNQVRNIVAVPLLAVAMTANPIAAETVADCYEKVLNMCAEALEGARFYEKPIIGAMCTAMMLGCSTTIVVNK
jgi:hypothetical protein